MTEGINRRERGRLRGHGNCPSGRGTPQATRTRPGRLAWARVVACLSATGGPIITRYARRQLSGPALQPAAPSRNGRRGGVLAGPEQYRNWHQSVEPLHQRIDRHHEEPG